MHCYAWLLCKAALASVKACGVGMKIPSLKARSTYWDRRFEKGEIYGTKPSKAAKLIMKDAKPLARILVVGGGYGRNAAYLAKHKHEVLSTDSSKRAIAMGRRLYGYRKNLRFKRWDICGATDFEKKPFDAVVAIYCLSLFTRAELNKIFKKIRQLIQRGGKFYANFLALDDGEYGQGKEIMQHTFLHEDGQLVRFFSKKEILGLFKAHNFKINRILKIGEKRRVKNQSVTSRSYLVFSKK